MEVLTIVLASLLSIGSSGGFVLDRVVQGKIRSQVSSVEQQAVRIDNRPNYRVAQGKIARIRIANRGVIIEPGVRIAALDLETDPLAVKLDQLKLGSLEDLQSSLAAPASGVAKLVFTEADLNQALESPEIQAQLQKTLNRFVARRSGSNNVARYQISDISLEMRPKNRLQVSFKLDRARPKPNLKLDSTNGTSSSENTSRELVISLELAFQIVGGQAIRLINPQGTVNGRPMSSRLLNGFAEGISDRLNLNTLEADGILARILQLEINEDNLQLVGFFRLETEMP
ncbi:MAG: DUF2993 domain-containing protein [Cyanobacteria bacterium P01_C01_bin.72]